MTALYLKAIVHCGSAATARVDVSLGPPAKYSFDGISVSSHVQSLGSTSHSSQGFVVSWLSFVAARPQPVLSTIEVRKVGPDTDVILEDAPAIHGRTAYINIKCIRF